MSAEREQILVNNSAQTLLDHLCVTVVLAIGLIWMVILAMVTTFFVCNVDILICYAHIRYQ